VTFPAHRFGREYSLSIQSPGWSYRAKVSEHSPRQTAAPETGHGSLLLCVWWKIQHGSEFFPYHQRWVKNTEVPGWKSASGISPWTNAQEF